MEGDLSKSVSENFYVIISRDRISCKNSSASLTFIATIIADLPQALFSDLRASLTKSLRVIRSCRQTISSEQVILWPMAQSNLDCGDAIHAHVPGSSAIYTRASFTKLASIE